MWGMVARVPTLAPPLHSYCSSQLHIVIIIINIIIIITSGRLDHVIELLWPDLAAGRPGPSFIVDGSLRSRTCCRKSAPYSAGVNFRQYFYDILYSIHPLTSLQNFAEIAPEEPSAEG